MSWPCIETDEIHEPLLSFRDEFSTNSAYGRWLIMVKGNPLVDWMRVLPAVMVRIPDCGGEPPLFLDERPQRHPAPATHWGIREWTAPPEAPVEHGTPITFSQPSEPLSFVADEMREVPRDLYEQLQALPPSQFASFLLQHIERLPVAAELQPQKP